MRPVVARQEYPIGQGRSRGRFRRDDGQGMGNAVTAQPVEVMFGEPVRQLRGHGGPQGIWIMVAEHGDGKQAPVATRISRGDAIQGRDIVDRSWSGV